MIVLSVCASELPEIPTNERRTTHAHAREQNEKLLEKKNDFFERWKQAERRAGSSGKKAGEWKEKV